MVQANIKKPTDLASLPGAKIYADTNPITVEVDGKYITPADAVMLGAPAVHQVTDSQGESHLFYDDGSQLTTTFYKGIPTTLVYHYPKK